jgi:crossover junction endodeoxyribonuclease RuvC
MMQLSQKSPVVILGIDPGYDRVGWCVAEVNGGQLKLLEYGSVETSKSAQLIARYQQIDTEITALLQKYHPQEAALESLFFFANKTTAMHVSEARGVIISALFRHQVECFEYTPLQVKQAVTGYGRADKSAVERMVRMQVGLSNAKVLDDTIDAVGVAITHAASRQLKKI